MWRSNPIDTMTPAQAGHLLTNPTAKPPQTEGALP
jgi:hypothetical protein